MNARDTMDQSAGYVRLYRKLLQNPIWTQLSPAVAKVSIFFLLRANFKPTQWYDGKETIDVPAGSFITSYGRTAAACNLSIQQIRDAFTHLFRTQFATYRRTERWTLVTVLNWAGYQASLDEAEHTEEHAVEQPENRQGTLDKELRIKNTPPTPSFEGEESAVLTLVPPKERARRTAKPKPYEATLDAVAHSIHARHPAEHERRDCGVEAVKKKLTAILKHKKVPVAQCAEFLHRVDENHASLCASEDWNKDGRQFAKALSNYLAPTQDRYEVRAVAAIANKTAPRLMA